MAEIKVQITKYVCSVPNCAISYRVTDQHGESYEFTTTVTDVTEESVAKDVVCTGFNQIAGDIRAWLDNASPVGRMLDVAKQELY